jgi:hypothetical protein
MNPKLCRFCGGGNCTLKQISKWVHKNFHAGGYVVECPDCGANGPITQTRADAHKAWQGRDKRQKEEV